MKKYFFSDLQSGGNLEEGLKYFAAGIIESKHFDDSPSVSGKDYCVAYISPFGTVERQWRATSEIEIYEVDLSYFEQLENTISEREIGPR